MATNTLLLDAPLDGVSGAGTVDFEIERLPLMDGIYPVHLGAHTRDGGTSYDHRAEKDVLEVMSSGRTQGRVHFPMRVRIDGVRTPR